MINPTGSSAAAQMFMADDKPERQGGGLLTRLHAVSPVPREVS